MNRYRSELSLILHELLQPNVYEKEISSNKWSFEVSDTSRYAFLYPNLCSLYTFYYALSVSNITAKKILSWLKLLKIYFVRRWLKNSYQI